MVEVKEIEEKATAVVVRAQELTITSNEGLTAAGELLTGIKALRKDIAGRFNPIIEKAHLAHREALLQKKRAEAPLIEAEKIIKPRIAAYTSEQERLRRAEEARLQTIADKKAEDERLERAAEAEKAGNTEEAEGMLEEEEFVPPVVLAPATPKVEGISIRKRWIFKIVNESLIPRAYLTPDTVKIGGVVRSMKGEAKIPGIRIYQAEEVAAGVR